MGGATELSGPLRGFGVPPDPVAWLALAGAGVVVFLAMRPLPWERLVRSRATVPVLACLAALLSLAYVTYYLRGGPRIIDATAYWLEAHALAQGKPSFSVIGPTASFRGRFLLTAPGSEQLAVVFPPGYPLALSLGVLLGFPLLVGPLIAAMLALVTFRLGLRLWQRRDAACVAAAFSVLCATLRYHTSDTMSHGWAALLLATSVLFGTSSRRSAPAVVGFTVGMLVATRPVSGVVGLVVLAMALWNWRTWASVGLTGLALLPGLALLAWHQQAATGSPWGSSHLRYYLLADGPVGCFRYGFGAGIGCLHEHGDFVRQFLPEGHGVLEGLASTGRRLRLHLMDVANIELVALLVPWAAWRVRHTHAGKLVIVAIVCLIAGYVPFYFDGNYPGGGARLFADLLPLEHALLGGLVLQRWWTSVAFAGSLLGFALHTSFEHRALAEREGGAPMFYASALAAQGIESGVVFVNTDHAFNLGHNPTENAGAITVARYSGGAHDRVLLQELDQTHGYTYFFDPTRGTHTLSVYSPASEAPFEAAMEWPLLEARGGWARPAHSAEACVQGGRGLALHPTGDQPMSAVVELFVSRSGRYRVETAWAALTDAPLVLSPSVEVAGTRWETSLPTESCASLLGPPLWLERGRHRMTLTVYEHGWLLDSFRTLPAGPRHPKRR